jgi:mycofactocin precursor
MPDSRSLQLERTPAAETTSAVETDADEDLDEDLDELLVEEVSIDGMCGVY